MIPSAPDTVVDANGQPLSGTFRGVPGDASLGRLSTVSRWTRAMCQKRWIYIGLFSPDLVVGGCVVDLTYLANGFAFAFHCKEGELLDHHHLGPRVRQVVPDSPVTGTAHFSLPGAKIEICSDARPGAGWRRLKVEMGRGPQRLQMQLEVEDDSTRVEPLCAITPLPNGRMSYTLKSVGLPVRGTVTTGQRTVELTDALAAVDYTHCIPEHHTSWHWVCAAGRTTSGRLLGLNLVDGWNTPRPAENAAWVDGKLVALGPVEFSVEETCWRVVGHEVDLRFFPLGERRQDVDLKLIASRYVQPFGRFEGELRCGDETLQFQELWGVTEDHEAAW